MDKKCHNHNYFDPTTNAINLSMRFGLGQDMKFYDLTEYRRSYIYRFKQRDSQYAGDKGLITVKIIKQNQNIGISKNLAENEYKNLETIHKLSGTIHNLVIPKPLKLLRNQNGIIMENVDAASLREVMHGNNWLNSESRSKKLKPIFGDIGRILGTLQLNTYSSDCSIDKKKFVIDLRTIETLTRNSFIRRTPRVIKQALVRINDAISTVDWAKIGLVWVHGDLIPSNILVTRNGKIGLIDFDKSRFGSPYHDISHFVVRTLLDFSYNFKYSSKCIGKLNQNFLTEYIRSFPYKLKDNLFWLYCSFNTLQNISFLHSQRITSRHLHPNSILRDRYALSLLNEYLKLHGSS
jgi:thiamine kinase-like enzyme